MQIYTRAPLAKTKRKITQKKVASSRANGGRFVCACLCVCGAVLLWWQSILHICIGYFCSFVPFVVVAAVITASMAAAG